MTLNALSFTLIQAFLSALGAVGFGAILAIGFSRFSFRGRRVLEAICYLPFFLPPLAVVLSVIALYGQSGFEMPVFGLFGILMAHWILNIPVVLYFLSRAYQSVPPAQIILASQLGKVWRLIDLDVMRRVLPTAFAIVFLYASLSFTIVLTLGGGAQSTTLEMGIYQAVRYDFNLALAGRFAILQMALGMVVYMIARKSFEPDWPEVSAQIPLEMPKTMRVKITMLAAFAFTFMLLIAPIAQFAINAMPKIGEVLHVNGVAQAAWNSLWLGLMTITICQFFAAILVMNRLDNFAWLIGATSPLVLAVGLILLVRPFANPFSYGVIFVALFQALAMLPLIVSAWRGRVNKVSYEERRLMDLLMPRRAIRFKRFWLPHLRGTMIETSALILALSIGDLALMPLFSPPDFVTLPVLIWQMIGSYRFEFASALALIVLLAVFVLLGAAQIWNKYMEAHNA